MRERGPTDSLLFTLMERASARGRAIDLFAPTRLCARAACWRRRATLLVTYFDSVCREGESVPRVRTRILLGVWSRLADSDRSRDDHYVLNCVLRWCVGCVW